MTNNKNGREVLSFDIGNSRIKWALWRVSKTCSDEASSDGTSPDEIYSGKMLETGSVSSSVDSLQTLMSKMSGLYRTLGKILAVNVAGEEMKCALMACVKQNWAQEVRFLCTAATYSGRGRTLTNAYANPVFHGADRWAGLIAASHEFSGALCVISAGTAITFDLLEADGRHLGGRILPSLQTMGEALLSDAAAIDVTPANVLKSVVDDVPALFASDTQGAIGSGVYYLLAAGVREACVQASATLSQPPVFVITGGGAEQIMQLAQMPEMKHRPDLILQGVYFALN